MNTALLILESAFIQLFSRMDYTPSRILGLVRYRVVTKPNPVLGRRTLCLECIFRILGWINSSGENQTFYNPVPDNLEYVRGYNPYD